MREYARVNCALIAGTSGSGKVWGATCLDYETGRPLQRSSSSKQHVVARDTAVSGFVGGVIASGGTSS